MANNKSALKRIRIAERNRIRNKGYKTKLKSSLKNVESLLSEGKIDEAREALILVQKSAGKAVSKGAIHKNRASRKVSSVTTKLNAVAPAKEVKSAPVKKPAAKKATVKKATKETVTKTVKKESVKKAAPKKAAVKKSTTKKEA